MEPDKEVDVKKLIKTSVAEATPGMSPDQRKEYERALSEVVEEGHSPAEAMGFDQAMLQQFYGFGYNYFNSGKYKEAKNVFGALCHLDPIQPKYWYGLAASFHKLKEYELAKTFYMTWWSLDPENPIPFFHASACCLQLKQLREAILFLYKVIEKCGDKPEYQKIKEKAKATQDRLKEQVGWNKKE